ncbi:sel1 repeat family protein [Planctomycetota bacterium]|nr:sel1 repeat family protein [Planctomycetota bacterium]
MNRSRIFLTWVLSGVLLSGLSWGELTKEEVKTIKSRAEVMKPVIEKAEQGKFDAKMAQQIGDFYEEQKEFDKSWYWYQKAIELGSVDAKVEYAEILMHGLGQEQDMALGLKVMEEALNEGSAAAYGFKGMLYSFGHGVEKDVAKGRSLMLESIKRGNVDAMRAYGRFLMYRVYDEVEEAAEDEAVVYLKMAHDGGDRKAAYYLGYCYEYEIGGAEQDVEKVLYWYEVAAKNGSAEALYSLALIGLKQKGYTESTEESVEEMMLQKSAALEHTESLYELGCLYVDGTVRKVDGEKAKKWLFMAGKKGHELAYGKLAWMYQEGVGAEKDMVKAIEFYKKSARQGDLNAQVILRDEGISWEEGE